MISINYPLFMDTMYNLMYLSIKMGIFMDGDAKQPTFFVEPDFEVTLYQNQGNDAIFSW